MNIIDEQAEMDETRRKRMAYDNTNRGSIWKNDRKETETHPDFTGTINVDGVEYWLNGWRRKKDANPKAPAMTFTVRPKEVNPDYAKESKQGFRQPQEPVEDDFDQDRIPF